MTKRFGLGFETKSGVSPSTQRARASFLELLPQLKEKVVPALFDEAWQPFIEFLTDSRDKILSIDNDIGSSVVPSDTATRLFISDWVALRRQKKAAVLRGALRKWANDWNLTDEWCMDHAVAVLREQQLGALDAIDAWHEAVAFQLDLDSVCVQGAFNEEFNKRGLNKFSFKYEGIDFTIEGPMFRSIPEFRQEVKWAFKAAGAQDVRGARVALKHKLDEYLSKVSKVAEELNYTEPEIRWAEDHFRWLIYFQIPPERKTIKQLSLETGKDRKTIREGINDIAKLIGLHLISIPREAWLSKAGRPPSKK